MNKLTHSLLLCVAVLFIGCTEDEVPIFGDVYGTIYNTETGEPVRNAEIILSPNNMSTISGSDGHFEFRQLEAKQYTISVSADGYESNSRQITIIPGQSISCDMRLKPQAVVEIFDINPLTLNFGTTQTQMAVTVTNDSKKDAQWSLDLGQNTWLKASPIAGQIGAGKSQTIVFYANRSNLSEETSGIVTFSALGGSSSLTANCSPSKQVSSIMEVTPLDIDFGDQSTEQIFRIKNKSNALLNWTIFGLESDALSVSDTSGTIQAGNAKVISIKLDRSKGQANNLVTSFMVSDGTNDQQINVNVGSHESNVSNTDPDNTDQPDNQEAMGRLELPQDYIDFGLNDSVRPFTIKNVGDASVEWEITDVQDDIFTFSPDSGTLEAGNETEIQVAIDRDGLPAGADESAFAISDGVNKYIVTIQFMEPEYTDGKIKLLTSTLDFGTEAAKLDLKVENVGTTYLSWTISDIPDYITCYPTYKQGMKSIAITPIELNRATMPEAVDTFIIITNDYNPSDTHKVRITATKQNTSASSGSKIYYTSTDGNVVTPYKASAFGANIVSNVYENGQGVITFDGKITTIGENAFKQRNTLATITIPDGTTSIGDSAFESCLGLTEVIIPEGVTSIGGIAFFYCKTLSEITLPSTVSAIGDKAFAMCQGIANLYCKATTPPELEGYFTQTFPMGNVIDENIFVIWVPREAHSIYTTNSDWNVDYKEGLPSYNAEQLQPYDF